MSQSIPTADSVHDMAEQLVQHALRAGLVVTIEHRRLKPQAIGRDEYVIQTQPVRQAVPVNHSAG